MQRLTVQDELALAADEHLCIVQAALIDGVVTVLEQARIACSARHIRQRAEFAAIRTRFGLRVLRGGLVDNQLLAEMHDYRRLCERERAQDKASTGYYPEEAQEAA